MATAKTVEDYLKKNGINLGAKVGGIELKGMEDAGLSPEDVKLYIKKAGLSFQGNAENYLNKKYEPALPAETNNVSNDDFGIKNDNVAQGISGLDNALEYILNTPHKEGSTGAALKNEFIGNVASKFLDTQYRQSNADADASRGLFVRDAELTQDRADYLQRSEYDAFFNQLNQTNEFTLQNQFEFNRAQERLTELGLEADLKGNLRKIDGDQNRLTQDNAARNQIDLAEVQGVIAKDYMLQELKAAGVEDRELQKLVIDGDLDKILEKGKIETNIVGLNNDTKKLIANLNDKGLTLRLNNELASNERLANLKGAQALEQIKEELTLAGANQALIQRLQNEGALNQIKEQGAIDLTQLRLSTDTQIELQKLSDDGAFDRLNAELANNVTIQQMVGDQAKEQLDTQLRESGFNERALEELRQLGVRDQILEQGNVDRTLLREGGVNDRLLQTLVDTGAFERLNAELNSNKILQGMKGRQAIKQIETELLNVGINERELQRLKAAGVLEQISKQGQVDANLLRQTGLNDRDLQRLVGNQQFAQLQANIKSNEKIQSMTDAAEMARLEKSGQQNLQQIGAQGSIDLSKIELELEKAGVNERELQLLKDKGIFEQIDRQGNVDIRKITKELQLSGANEQTLEKIRNSSALQQIGAQGKVDIDKIGAEGNVQLDILDAQGRIDIDKIELELRKSGVNDRQLERLKNRGILEQIGAQGNIDIAKIKEELELSGINEQTLANINNSGVLQQIKAQQKADIAVQKLVGGQSVEQIQEQGKVDVSKIGATSVADQARIIAQSGADERLIKAQNLADTTLENIKSTNRQSETSLAGDIESRQIQERGDVEESRISAQGFVDKTIQGMVGDQAVEQIGAQGDQDVRKTKVAGDDTRKTLELENKLKSKDRANQSSYARNLAGMM